jgi:DNA polymerase-3 subunit delta
LKIAAPQIGGVLRDPKRFAGVLLHGDDPGLIRERALTMARAVVGSLDDPFLSCVLLKEEHPRLMEEARSLSLVGGRRVVRVVDAGDPLAAVATRLESAADGALVILEAGALTARSKLRQAAEKSPGWASIACYPETGAALTSEIRRAAGAAGLSLTDDALSFLTRELGSDTGTRRSELDKLFLFASGETQIDLDMATRCCARVTEASVDALLAAVMSGDMPRVGHLLQQVVDEGATGPGLIVMLSGRAQRLLKVRLEMQAGREAEEAVRSLMPPVFFRDVARFVREAQGWPEEALRGLLADARSADLACKRAGSRDATIASQLYLAASRRALRFNRGS